MERALLVLAVSSLLMLSSVEATRPVISPAMAPQSDLFAKINNNLNKIKTEAQLAAATFDRVAQEQSAQIDEDFTYPKSCGELYKVVIEITTQSVRTDDKFGMEMLRMGLDSISRLVDSCDSIVKFDASGIENPAKIYEKSIKQMTLEVMSLCQAVAGPKVDSIAPSQQ